MNFIRGRGLLGHLGKLGQFWRVVTFVVVVPYSDSLVRSLFRLVSTAEVSQDGRGISNALIYITYQLFTITKTCLYNTDPLNPIII